MRLTANELAREAADTGFQAEPLEKVIILLELLEAIRSHPFLKDRVALKVVDVHELAAGKLAALLSRTASRDLFDASQLRHVGGLDAEKLRLAFVVYGGISRKDWRNVSVDDITIDVAEANVMLLPLLRGQDAPSRDDLAQWTRALVSDCHDLLAMVLPLTDQESEFLERLNARGEIVPDLITNDEGLRNIIRTHPGLLWKAMNVRQHRGLQT